MALSSQQLADLQAAQAGGQIVQYYTLLASYGEAYGTLARSVADGTGLSGIVARGFAAAVAEDRGVALDSSDWPNISLRLMQEDYAARAAAGLAGQDNVNLSYQAIKAYHATVFAEFDLPPEAWTAFIPLALAGSNADAVWSSMKQVDWIDQLLSGSSVVLNVIGANLGATALGWVQDVLPFDVVAYFATTSIDVNYASAPAADWLKNMFLRGAAFAELTGGNVEENTLQLPDGSRIVMGNGAPFLDIPQQLLGVFGSGQADDGGLLGGGQSDQIFGFSGNDSMRGEAGDDGIAGGSGADTMAGGAGNDILVGGDQGATEFLGLADDLVTYEDASSGISFTVEEHAPSHGLRVGNDGQGGVDFLIGIEKIKLTAQTDTVVVKALDGSEPIENLEEVDASGGRDELDLTAISNGVIYNNGVVQKASAGGFFANALGVGDKINFRNFEELRFGAGNDKVVANTVLSEIYLGGGDDTLVYAAPGTRVFGEGGTDRFLFAPGVQIADATVDDRILLGAKVLTGGLHWKASANPYAWDLTRTLGYGLNKAGELVIHVKSVFGDIKDMFVADWDGGPGASGNIAGIYLAEVEMGVYRLLEDWPDHLTILGTWELFMGAMMKANYGVSLWKDVDPLVLDLDGDGLELTGISQGKLVFDLDGDGYGERTGWVRGDDGILVLDANNDGQIKDVSEMFGGPGQSGFVELATHDGNADGKINASDAVFANLKVWRDLDQDRQVDAGELFTLTQLGITSLGVTGTPSTGTNATNHINATGTFTRADGSTGTSSDVAFNLDNQNTMFLGDRTVSIAAAALPDLKGYGTLPDLHVAMTLTPSLQGVVSSNLSGMGQLDLAAMREALTPILTAWANASPVTGRPPLVAHDDVPILVEVVQGREEVSDFAYRATDTSTGQTYWKLASGAAIKDANDAVIARPTLQQVLDDTHLDGTWSSLDGGVIAFFERYMGESLPLDQSPTNPAAAAAGIGEVISGVWSLLNSMAVRVAMQGPLASFFPGLEYDVERDGFEATSARQLIPTFEAVFTQVDALGSSGLARLEAWQPILSVVIGDYRQPDELINTNGFLFSNIVAAYESVGLDLGIVAVAGALGLPADLIRTGTGSVTGGTDADLFYLTTGNQTLSGGLGPDTYVVGRNFGQDVINDVEGQSESHSEDVVRFADVASTGVTARREGLDLVVAVNGTSDELRIVNQFDGRLPGLGGGGDLSEETGVDYIVFSDGVSWNDFDIAKAVSRPESGDQIQTGTATIDVLDGGAGNDSLSGKDDADFYVFGREYGDDVIFEDISHMYLTEGDTVAFRPGIAFEDIVWSRVGESDDLLIKIRGDSGSLKIVGQFAKTYTGPFGEQFLNSVETFQFADGRMVSWQDVIDIIKATGGTDGNDSIYGYDLEDDLAGGKGDDYLSGGNENDTYRYKLGDGHDVIEENADNLLGGMTDKVVLRGILPDSITVTRPVGTDDIRLTFADGGTLLLKGQVAATATGPFGLQWFDRLESIVFEDAPGTTWTPETLMARALANAPSPGNDTIAGFWRQDRLDSGAGNDSLSGEEESDTYVFGRGYGQDTVSDYGNPFQTTDTDLIEFKSDVGVNDIVLQKSGNDLTLRISGTQDWITIKDQNFISTVGGYMFDIEEVRFADGTVWTPQFMREEYIRQAKTTGADSISGFSSRDTIDGGLGNDTLAGGDNADTYKFDFGSGQDVIRETVGNVSFDYTHDEVVFGAGITQAMVRAAIVGKDLELTFVGTTDKLTIKDTFQIEYAKVETFRFADGTSLTERQLIDLALAGGGTSGPDSLTGTNAADQINGLAGADTIAAVSGDDILIGGLDNDRLEGGNGNDIYRYDPGDGNDDIYDSGYADQIDTLELGVGITPAMVRLAWAADDSMDLLLSFDGQPGVIRLNQQNYLDYMGIDRLKFSDGTAWTQADMMMAYAAQAMTTGADTVRGMYIADSLSGGDGADVILADSGNDTLVGGAGNDRLEGSYGSDTYRYELGDGNDDLYDSGYPEHVDTLILGPGITTGMIRLAWATDDSDDLMITFDGQAGAIRLNEQAQRGGYGIDQVKFADGATWTADQLFARYLELKVTSGADALQGTDVGESIAGGAGDDTIDARSGTDTLVGGDGNDRLEGSYSSDLYRYNAGDGADVIYDDGYTTDNDVLELGAEFTKAGLHVAVAGDDPDDLILTFDGQAGAIRLDEQGRGYGVETVKFADGSTMTRTELAAAGSSAGTSGADTLPGSSGPDTINAGDGADSVGGLDGNDLVNGEGGADTIDAGAGDDTQMGGAGNDLLKGNAGADRFDGGDGVDTLDLSYTTGWVADLGAGSVTFGASTISDVVLNIENVIGGSGADAITGDSAANWLRGASGNDTMTGASGDDTLEGGSGANSLSGGDGADRLFGYESGSGATSSVTLTGGAGDDFLQGGTQADLYVFGADHGSDTISEWSTTTAGRDDIVRYLTGISPDDINVSRFGNDLLLTHDNGVDKIRVASFFGNANFQWAIERVEFADNTVWTREQLINMAAPQGTAGADSLAGSEVGETMSGGEGADSLNGASGNDLLYGDEGADTLDGGAGDDTHVGGAGDDLLIGNTGLDRFEGGDGVDTLDMTYYSGATVDLSLAQAFPTGATEVVIGVENLTGGSGADLFIGDAAANRLIGGGGADTLDGGAGADTLTGGTGNDQFRFGSLGHFATGSEYDLVADFATGDKLSLSGIDADTVTSGDQAFAFVGTAAFSNIAGQLRYVVGSGIRTVYGDTNGDGLADFQFQLTGTGALTASDFIL